MKSQVLKLLLVLGSILSLNAYAGPPEAVAIDESTIATLKDRERPLIERVRAAQLLARVGTSSDIAVLKDALWDSDLGLSTRCDIAVKLIEVEVPEGLEFLLIQYDLYRLEIRMNSRQTMGPVRKALQHLGSPQLVVALEERLKTETDYTMQNNIRTLLRRVRLNQLPLEKIQEIAADSDLKRGNYIRFEAIDEIGRRGGPDLIPFLKSLPPFQTSDRSFTGEVNRLNNWPLPEQIGIAVKAIESRQNAAALLGKNRIDLVDASHAPPVQTARPVEVRVFRGHKAPVRHIAVAPNGTTFLSVAHRDRDKGVVPLHEWIIWDVSTGKIIQTWSDPPERVREYEPSSRSAVYLPDSRSIFGLRTDLTLIDVRSAQVVKKLDGDETQLPVVSVSLSPDGKQLIGHAPQHADLIFLWDTTSGSRRTLTVPESQVAAFLPDGRLLVSCGEHGNRLRIFDLKTEKFSEPFRGESGSFDRLRVSPDGTLAVTSQTGNGVQIWGIAKQGLRTKSRDGSCAQFSRDNRHLLVGNSDGEIHVISSETLQEQFRFIAQRDVMLDVEVLPDGEQILTAGGGGGIISIDDAKADYAVRLWRIPKISSPP